MNRHRSSTRGGCIPWNIRRRYQNRRVYSLNRRIKDLEQTIISLERKLRRSRPPRPRRHNTGRISSRTYRRRRSTSRHH